MGDARLFRRRVQGAQQQCWHVFYGDVHVGTITERAGVPHDVDRWGWDCGFYPVTHRREHADGTAETFEQARADFEAAWAEYLPKCTPADFEEYRRQRAWTAWKYAMHDTGTKMPTAFPSGSSRCFCGAAINIASSSQHVYEVHMTVEPSL
jgi:hypothetical protein